MYQYLLFIKYRNLPNRNINNCNLYLSTNLVNVFFYEYLKKKKL